MVDQLDHVRADAVTVTRGDLDALQPADDPDTGPGRVPRNLAARPLVAGSALLAVSVGGYLRVVGGVGAASFAVGAGLLALWLLVT
jgi:hypothetical protein